MDNDKETNPVLDKPIIEGSPEVGTVEESKENNTAYTESISWSSLEENHHKRGSKWYLIWVLILLVLAGSSLAANILLGIWQLWTTVGLAIIVFIALVVVNKQPGRTINYKLTEQDITINDKTSPLSDFQAFSVTNNGDFQTISLVPVKRLSIPFDLIAPTKKADEIVDLLSIKLPLDQTGSNFTDKISSILKF